MSNVLARLKKRTAFPVTIDGDTFHVRALTFGELKRLEAITDIKRTWFVLGCGLVDESGSSVFDGPSQQTDAEWSDNIGLYFADVPTSTIKYLSDAIGKAASVPSDKAIEKNS